MVCDLGMMLMSDHDAAYVDAVLMVNMQANTRSVTPAQVSGPIQTKLLDHAPPT